MNVVAVTYGTSVFVYSAILYYVKLCLWIQESSPLIHSLSTLWIWPKFVVSLVCPPLFFFILLLLKPRVWDPTDLAVYLVLGGKRTRWKLIFLVKCLFLYLFKQSGGVSLIQKLKSVMPRNMGDSSIKSTFNWLKSWKVKCLQTMFHLC